MKHFVYDREILPCVKLHIDHRQNFVFESTYQISWLSARFFIDRLVFQQNPIKQLKFSLSQLFIFISCLNALHIIFVVRRSKPVWRSQDRDFFVMSKLAFVFEQKHLIFFAALDHIFVGLHFKKFALLLCSEELVKNLIYSKAFDESHYV